LSVLGRPATSVADDVSVTLMLWWGDSAASVLVSAAGSLTLNALSLPGMTVPPLSSTFVPPTVAVPVTFTAAGVLLTTSTLVPFPPATATANESSPTTGHAVGNAALGGTGPE
jgi:hypothetical protein